MISKRSTTSFSTAPASPDVPAAEIQRPSGNSTRPHGLAQDAPQSQGSRTSAPRNGPGHPPRPRLEPLVTTFDASTGGAGIPHSPPPAYAFDEHYRSSMLAPEMPTPDTPLPAYVHLPPTYAESQRGNGSGPAATSFDTMGLGSDQINLPEPQATPRPAPRTFDEMGLGSHQISHPGQRLDGE